MGNNTYFTDREVATQIIDALEDNRIVAIPSYIRPIVEESIVMSFENMAREQMEYLPREKAMVLEDVIDGVFSIENDENAIDAIEDKLREIEAKEEEMECVHTC